MNIVHYHKIQKSDTVYIIVDRTNDYDNDWIKELVKNITDYTVSNIYGENYDVLVGVDEDQLLVYAANYGYLNAVVLSSGTEFINGASFFNNVKSVINDDFFIMGHILDRGVAYYELHHQCYIINLKKYNMLGRPVVGDTILGESHQQFSPQRSQENIHDNYTPTWIKHGNCIKQYDHKLHGWNILAVGLAAGYSIQVFADEFRNNKKYYYPENKKEFNNQLSWSYARERYCLDKHVHKENTEIVDIEELDFDCVITPASGTWFIPYISKNLPVKVIYYDYNQSSLDYWKEHAIKIDNVSYEYVNINLLGVCDYSLLIPEHTGKTIINLSNIFCYEGTCMFTSLEYRLNKENQILKYIPKNVYVFFSSRSCNGFFNTVTYGTNLPTIDIKQLVRPTWHTYDWT